MKQTLLYLLGALGIILVCIGFAFWQSNRHAQKNTGDITANYLCDTREQITATYHPGSVTLTLFTLPTPRTLQLAQTISADGGRYANKDESIVFWDKGGGGTFTEGGVQTYRGCTRLADDPGDLAGAYENSLKGFSVRYPYPGYSVDPNYSYAALGPQKAIGGVKFTIPPWLATGTNLSPDSYLSVEEIPEAATCNASLFLDQGARASASSTNREEGGTTYSVASTTDAAAGNRYEETVYALPGTNPCIAVRYFVHYGVIENYTQGAVKAFDRAALLAQFDSMRHTLIIAQ